jgi:osmotically-inducible protein OsmY
MLRSGGRIQVVTQGEAVVLRGGVRNDREKRVAEAMIRMTPGVREVINELVVDPVVEPGVNPAP